MNKYIEIWLCIHVSTSVRVHEKKFNTFFENKMAAQNLSQTNPFFFGDRTTTGPDFAAKTKNEKDSGNIYINKMSIVRFFRKIQISKKFCDAHSIFIYIFRIFLVFCSRCKIATGSGLAVKKKLSCLREILRRHFIFKRFIKCFFMYLNPCKNLYAKPNFNIFILFSWMKSIIWPFISCSQGRITP